MSAWRDWKAPSLGARRRGIGSSLERGISVDTRTCGGHASGHSSATKPKRPGAQRLLPRSRAQLARAMLTLLSSLSRLGEVDPLLRLLRYWRAAGGRPRVFALKLFASFFESLAGRVGGFFGGLARLFGGGAECVAGLLRGVVDVFTSALHGAFGLSVRVTAPDEGKDDAEDHGAHHARILRHTSIFANAARPRIAARSHRGGERFRRCPKALGEIPKLMTQLQGVRTLGDR